MEPELKFYCDSRRHLICVPYSEDNLHAMAYVLGIKRAWFHNTPGLAHYDIPVRRVDEITAKCTVVSSKELVQLIKGKTDE